MMTERSDRVLLVVEDCVDYWRRTGVPRSAVAGMREDLEQHLQDAVAAGKSVESVTGPDVLAFAEEWAREFRGPEVMLRRIDGRGPAFLALAAAILCFLSFLGLGVYAGVGTVEVCCPRRVIEQGTTVLEPGLMIWALLILAAVIAGIVGSVFLFRGRLRLGAGIVLAAAPLALLTLFNVVSAGLLVGAGVWALARARRAEAPVPAP
jgi:hypothetical protein